jgi:hypothetical protein
VHALTDLGIDEQAIQTLRPSTSLSARRSWLNHRAPAILRELEHYVAPGCRLVVRPGGGRRSRARVDRDMHNPDDRVPPGDTTDRATPKALNRELQPHHRAVLPDQLTCSAPTRTLVTLLHLRDMERAWARISRSSRNADIRNRQLAVTHADDFIVSDDDQPVAGRCLRTKT